MTHGIQTTDKIYLHQTAAWHDKGGIFATPLGSEACRLYVCPWEPKDRFLWIKTSPDSPASVKIPDRKAIVRSDNGAYLGVVGAGYQSVGNRELFDMIETALPGASYETAGTLFGGRRVWALAKLDSFDVGANDENRSYLMIANGHDGSFRVFFGMTAVRIVCNNTLTSAIFQAKEGSDAAEGITAYRHTKNVKARVLDAAGAIRKAREQAKQYAMQAQAMARIKMGGLDVRNYFESIYPSPKAKRSRKGSPVDLSSRENAAALDSILAQQEQGQDFVGELLAGDRKAQDRAVAKHEKLLASLIDLYHAPQNAGEHGENLWTAFNAITDQLTNNVQTRGENDSERSENRFVSSIWGAANELKQAALSEAVKLLSV